MLHWTIGETALEFYKALGEQYTAGKPEVLFLESSVAENAYLGHAARSG